MQACWPGWSRSSVTWARLHTFAGIYLPAALSVASDFWRMSAIGALARLMGPTELAVFNASYRVLWMCLIFIGSIAAAISIKLGNAFGTGQVPAWPTPSTTQCRGIPWSSGQRHMHHILQALM